MKQKSIRKQMQEILNAPNDPPYGWQGCADDLNKEFEAIMNTPPGFLPLHEAATWSGVSVWTIKRWITKGLPKYQAGPGEKILIRPADIEAFLMKKN